ncbi:MAG: MBL fold metallo-hydrolase [Bdellovibrionales bacterium]|nr:MBL fold metallo-hydrolase [Bdellovibrionales bacterium]
MKIGEYEVSTLVCDHIALDGGAMFGSVPKTLWERAIPADARNRISMACRLMLIKGSDRTFLVDLGCGDKWSDKDREIFAISSVLDMPLTEVVGPVTDVIVTHLHFDHVGGISQRTAAGDLELCFPDARIHCSRKNLEHARKPGIRERASYLRENIDVLDSANLSLTEDGDEIAPGITVHQANGHTHGLQWVKVSDGSNSCVFPSDLMPTAHHVSVPWVMGYDLCAETSMREKEQFLEQAASQGWTVVFEHDRDTAAGVIERDERGRYRLKSAISL